MLINLQTAKRGIVEVGKRIYDRGYVASNDGNISARLDENRFLITPSGVSKGFMKMEDLVTVAMDGKVISRGKKPSSEMWMHIEVYKNRPEVNSVCHAHPPYATGFAVAGLALDKCVLPEVILSLGSIPLVAYGTPGTDELVEPLIPLLAEYDAFLLANHGALTIGKDILNAYHKMETLEHYAHIAFVAKQLGNVNVLGDTDVQKLAGLRANFGISTNVGCDSGKPKSHLKAEANQQKENTAIAEADIEKQVMEITERIMKQLNKL
jgi:L-fuculose-phosphate aldolase